MALDGDLRGFETAETFGGPDDGALAANAADPLPADHHGVGERLAIIAESVLAMDGLASLGSIHPAGDEPMEVRPALQPFRVQGLRRRFRRRALGLHCG
jgi:hypothetical protein